MNTFLSPILINYFFGDQFNFEVAEKAISLYAEKNDIEKNLQEKTKNGELHLGIRLVSYLDIDTGMSVSVLQQMPQHPSLVTFFASSKHRFFGGQTLVCIPLQFCISSFLPDDEYIVYRHTFKKPSYDKKELKHYINNGTDEQKNYARIFPMTREAYETISGMSYVGMSKRSWQERYVEHTEQSMKKSSSTLFHNAIRDMQGKQVIHVHEVSAFGLNKEQAKSYEKKLIKESTLHPKGLNMKAG